MGTDRKTHEIITGLEKGIKTRHGIKYREINHKRNIKENVCLIPL